MEAPDPLIGAHLGEYEVVELIGEGGTGVVYRGLHPDSGQPVAIKVLKPGSAAMPDQVQRLLEEARSVNAIGHDGIIDIFATGELSDGRHYLVMEFLQGQSLDRQIADQGPAYPLEAIALLKAICGPLAAAHASGIVHRDLKPSNVFVVFGPDDDRFIKLLDFGLAKQIGGAAGPGVPKTGATTIVGTVEYMAPEQVRAEAVSPRTDLYSLGVLAFELLTSQRPFQSPSFFDVLRQQLELIPPPPSSLVEGIPAALDALVLQLMAKDANRRPVSAEAVRDELTLIESELLRSLPPEEPPAPAPRRSRLVRIVTGVVVAGSLLVGVLVAKACTTGAP